jgi:hypothetical protein
LKLRRKAHVFYEQANGNAKKKHSNRMIVSQKKSTPKKQLKPVLKLGKLILITFANYLWGFA